MAELHHIQSLYTDKRFTFKIKHIYTSISTSHVFLKKNLINNLTF